MEKKLSKEQRITLEVFQKLKETNSEMVIAVLITGLVTTPKIKYFFPIGENWVSHGQWKLLTELERKQKIVYWGSFKYKGKDYAQPDVDWYEMPKLFEVENLYGVSQKTIEFLFNKGLLKAGDVFSTPSGLCVEFNLI